MLLSIIGTIGSGKDTAANFLVEEFGYKKIAFADSLKDVLSSVFGWERHLLNGDTVQSREFRETVDKWWESKLGIPGLTPRKMLTAIGTDLFRKHFSEQIWLASLEKRLISMGQRTIITDVRFSNEFYLAKTLNATTIRVVRKYPEWWEYACCPTSSNIKLLEDFYGIHSSEYSQAQFVTDETIHNNGSLEDFKKAVLELHDSISA